MRDDREYYTLEEKSRLKKNRIAKLATLVGAVLWLAAPIFLALVVFPDGLPHELKGFSAASRVAGMILTIGGAIAWFTTRRSAMNR